MVRLVEVDPRFGTLIVVICGVGFTLAALLLAAYLIYVRRLAVRSADWPATEGEVIRSSPQSYSTAYFTTHDARVTYRYWVQGKKHVSSSVTPESVGFGSRREAEEVAARFPPGAKVTVYYDPGRAVLLPGKRGAGSVSTVLLATIVLVLLVGVYFLFFVR